MTSMSIKERIRALNLQSSGGAPESPTRQSGYHRQQLPSSSFHTPLPSPSSVPLQAAASALTDPSPSTKSPLKSSPTSEKAQLFKAAKVIRKAFDSDVGHTFLDGGYSCNSQPSSPNSRQTADENEGNDDFADEEDLDATTALQSWRAKDKGNDDPSFHDVISHTNKGRGNSMIDDDHTILPGTALHPEAVVQSASTDSALEQYVSRNEVASNKFAIKGESEVIDNDTDEEKRPGPMDAAVSDEQKITTPLQRGTDEPGYEFKSSQYSMAGGEPYRAYARRSRLRSPRGLGTSPESNFADTMDGTQSVTSAQSALSQSSLSQISSLSTRATRYLKDKKDRRKEAAFLSTGGGIGDDAMNNKFDELAKDIVQNTLRNNICEKEESLVNYSRKEWTTRVDRGGPQKIDIQPSKPKMSDYISDLNRDVFYHDQYQAHDDRQPTRANDKLQRINPKSEVREYQTEEDQIQYDFNPTASLDESSCSELKAKDLFDKYRNGGRDMKRQSYSENNYEFTAFQHGVGKSFDTGCQVLESMNPLPLLESAFNALSAHSQTKGIFFSNARKSGVRNTYDDGDAPYDERAIPSDDPICETVAIEVEYVEHGDEHQSVAETDSVFSVSTRDLESYT